MRKLSYNYHFPDISYLDNVLFTGELSSPSDRSYIHLSDQLQQGIIVQPKPLVDDVNNDVIDTVSSSNV